MLKKAATFFIATVFLLPLLAHSDAGSYIQSIEITRPAKASISAVDVYLKDQNPTRQHVILGNYTQESDGVQTQENLLDIARARAAEIGADFVKVKAVSVRTKTKKEVSGVAFIGIHATAETETKSIPKMVISFGAYTKSTLGITWDSEAAKSKKMVVSGFRSFSFAEKAGVRVGDELLEVNGMLPADKRLQTFFIDSEPGTVVKLFIKRDGKSLSVDVPTVEAL